MEPVSIHTREFQPPFGAFGDDVAPVPPPSAVRCSPGGRAMLRGRAHPDLQSALDTSSPGDTVIACRGTHTGPYVIPHAGPLVLRGETGSPADVVLNTVATDPIIIFGQYGTQARFQAITMTGLSGSDGIFDSFWEDAVQIVDSVITNNEAADGLIDLNVGHFLIERSEISNNRSTYDTIDIGTNSEMASLIFRNVKILDNVATGHSAFTIQVDPDFNPPTASRVLFDNVDIINNDNPLEPNPRDPTWPDYRWGSVGTIYNMETAYVGFRDVTLAESDFGGGGITIIRTDIASVEPVTFACLRCSFTDNSGMSGQVLEFAPISGLQNNVGTIRDSEFLRNELITNPIPEPDIYAVLDVQNTWTVNLDNVDLGAGPDTNLPRDINCLGVDYGPGTSGFIAHPHYCL